MPESPLKDKNYNLVAMLQDTLRDVYHLETYIKDAEHEGDQEVQDFFRSVQQRRQESADQAKKLLHERLETEGG